MTPITNPWRLWIGGATLLLLSACGGGDGLSNEVTTQTMTKVVAGGSCRPKLEDTTFVADIQAIQRAGLTTQRIYCKSQTSTETVDLCPTVSYWFEIFIDVAPSQVGTAETLGYVKFAPRPETEYVDFKCLPDASQL